MSNKNEGKDTNITSQSYMQAQHEAQMESWLDFVWDNKDSATYSINDSTFLKLSKALVGIRQNTPKNKPPRPLEFRRNGESIYLERGEIGNTDDTSRAMLLQRYYVRLTPRERYTTYVSVYPYYYVLLLWENWRKEYREKNNYNQGFHLKKNEAILELKVMADFLEDQYNRDEREEREKMERKKAELKTEKIRRYYAANREKRLAYQRKYQREKREKILARRRKYYAKEEE